MAAPLSVSANPDTATTISDSCNCASCISCCVPFRGRNVEHVSPEMVRQERTGSDVEIHHTETTLKVHGASQPVLQEDGQWVIEVDGKKYSMKELK